MAITSKDIAKLAGVSRSAVSAVLNGHYNKVSLEKREKILAIAQDLRYRPNPAALILAKKKTRRIGIITSPFMSGIYSDLTSKIAFLLRERNYSSSLVTPLDAKQELEAVMDFESFGADGIIIAYALNDVKKLNTKIPLVSMSPYPGQYELRVDLKYAFELAVNHFRTHGHRKIGFVCPDLSVVPLQWEGYLAAIGASGAYKLEVTENPKFAQELDAMIQEEGVRAWCVTNDLLAARLMRHLLSAGYRVPEDAALIGFDGSAFVEVTPCPLTTIVFPAARIAERCIELLFEKIESSDTAFRPEPELVKPGLHIGESCGCRAGKPYRISWDRQILTLDDGIAGKKTKR